MLVDGVYTTGANGEIAYEPRSQEELERIEALVRTAIGFDPNRGDQVEVVNLRFADAPTPEILPQAPTLVESLLNPTREDVLRAIELGVIFLLTLVVIFTVLRPMLRALKAPPFEMATATAGGSRSGGGQGAIEGGRTESGMVADNSATSQMIEMAKVNGQVQQQSLERVADLVKSSPTETVSVLRQWIHERG